MEKYHSCNISHCAMFQLKIGLLINSKSRFNNNNYSVKKVLIRCRQRQICNSYILGPSYFCEIWALFVSGITYGHFWPLIYLSIYLSIFLSILLSIDLSISIYIIFIYIYIYIYINIYQLNYLYVFSDYCSKWNFCDRPWNILIYWSLQKSTLRHGTFWQASIHM